MSTGRPTSPLPVISEEHQELRTLLASLARRLSGPPWEDTMVISLLDSLREHLEAHFAYEESDGGFDELTRTAPWVADRVDALVAEHRQLLAQACELASHARSAPRAAPNWTDLQEKFGELNAQLLSHEAREHDLLQEVYVQDIGDKD